MEGFKYLSIDLHIASITYLLMSAAGRVLQQSVIPTSAASLRKLMKGIRGQIIVTFEEGTLSQWAYEIIQPLVHQVIVCNPRRNKLLEEGSKADKIDCRKLADLLRTGMLKAVYHGSNKNRLLKELTAFYIAIVSDTTRAMSRLKAVFRSRGIQTGGRSIYYPKNRDIWLSKLDRPEKRERAEMIYKQLDFLRDLRREAKKKMLAAARAEKAVYRLLMSVPGLGPIRVAILMAIVVTPYRFRTKRQFWTYSGLSVITRTSSDYEHLPGGRIRRIRRQTDTRGLTREFNHLLKYVLKGAASDAIRREPFKSFYKKRLENGTAPELARLTVARKIGAIVLALWKKGELFHAEVMLKKTA
jgi:transposase